MENTNTRRGFTQKNKVILNLIQDLQRLPLLLLNNLRGRCQIKFGMTALFNNSAFTLIELLVVVLIIGILAAVAVPQYQKAVDKSRYVQMISAARSIENAQEVFYLANGRYATDFDELDVSISKDLPTKESEEDNRFFIGSAGFWVGEIYTSSIYFDGDDRVASFTLYHKNGTLFPGEIRCITYVGQKKRGQAICEGMGGILKQGNPITCSGTNNTVCAQYQLANL